jgi:aryl-alcohol dehydrogenase-like predicted oxidoreductase
VIVLVIRARKRTRATNTNNDFPAIRIEEENMTQHREATARAQAAPKIDRRRFLQAGLKGTGTIVAASLIHSSAAAAATPPAMTNIGADQIPRKPLGRTGEQISIIGLGGYHLGTLRSLDDAVRIVQEAVDAGVTFFDNAWEYNDHRSEEWMGRALQGRRDKVFLMTKVCTHGRDKKVAMQQLEESLQRLRTDHLDLWQIHEVIYENDPDLHFAKGGVIEALDEAKKQGKVRFVGFTGHKSPAIHLKMLAHNYPFDTVQMPLNCFDGTYRSFEQQVLPELERRGIAALGMKSLGGDGQPILHGVVGAEEALRYAMSLPVATTISGIDSLAVLRQNLAIARGFKPMTPEEKQALRQRCASFAGDGHLELYKSTKKYDGGVGREQHGYPPAEELPF